MAGILHCLEPDHIRRGRQGMPTHFLSQNGNTPKQFCGIQPHLQIKHCAAQSHTYFCFDRSWHVVCFTFPPRHVLLLSLQHPTLPHPASFLPEMSEVRTLSFGTWEFGGIFWHYRAASVLYHAIHISCYTITVTI